MKCNNELCQREVGDAQYCPYCGTYQEKTAKMHCLFCGAELGEDFVFCSRCGNKSVIVLLKELVEKEVNKRKVARTVPPKNQPPLNLGNAPKGVRAVDLGLPSGTLWASCNVGATCPEEYGGYYGWGETEENAEFSWKTYAHCDGSNNTCHDIGASISGTEYDVAHVKWGGNWQMPTDKQIKELMDKCALSWERKNGVEGCNFIGPNSNSIFLPAAGFRWHDSSRLLDIHGNYWYSWKPSGNAYYLNFRKDTKPYISYYHSCVPFYGQSVRPVYVK